MKRITSINLKADPKLGNMNGWQERHNAAVLHPSGGFERIIVGMIEQWGDYATMHETEYESLIGDDGVLGDHWRDIGQGILGLLNGSTGNRLDCGTLDHAVRAFAKANNAEIEK